MLIVLLVSLYIYYKKYKITKLRLDYEVNDLRNLASLPKSTEQMAELKTVAKKEKYTSLTETA